MLQELSVFAIGVIVKALKELYLGKDFAALRKLRDDDAERCAEEVLWGRRGPARVETRRRFDNGGGGLTELKSLNAPRASPRYRPRSGSLAR